ncbi:MULTISPECIES: 50S ribosomal protein L3 N(5)-glutamine methyltransferase [Nitrincola]|uniref:Ribosomal protein uL3 glutamine methyltransferase n=1 Tax=Nitrincola nitratireducens TaxID=1229521 RepID=W9V8F5_9GAMM|nr:MULTISPECIES: 50S ribosomal protein L3 N(5)-glutamine methyltransferase [Nitrincola]EXJ12327.1 50S ribosomal protein L3 glutamine methyltransferase [Nitrincola nitratireducens]
MSTETEQIRQDLQTIRDYIRLAMTHFQKHSVFYGHGTDNAWDEAVQLVLNAVHLPWDANPAILDAKLTQDERIKVLDFIRRRAEERIPLPYLVGEAWFLGMPFYVDERVLIPRSPIAELIEQEFDPWLRPGQVDRILDLCTGSGCIGIACAYAFPEAEVDLADISTDALDVAQSNVERHELNGRVQVIESDLFNALKGKRYDLIVSNPPYVDLQDLSNMPAEFHHEPALALGSGDQGLDITRRILREACEYLDDEGLLVVEVGNSEAHLIELYPEVPFMWAEFEKGGNGVFMISARDLRPHISLFQ